MMKILLITTDIDHIEPFQYVGVVEKGAVVHAICDISAANLDILRNAGIPLSTVQFKGRRDKEIISFIRNEIEQFQPDIVHVLRKKALSNTIPALKNSSAKLVAYRGIVGNLSFLDPVSRMTFLNPRIDRIVCVAEAIRTHFIKMGFGAMRLDPNKIITIHKGHFTENYQNIEKCDLSAYGIPKDDFVIACTASMRPRKRVDVLVKAFSQLDHEGTSLLLVGDIKDPKITQAIESSSRKEKIFALGKVSQQDALSIAGTVDVITMPSTKREGLPRALIEAMGQGTPAVVTNIGGSPELVEDGVSGFVVPPSDVGAFAHALNEILSDKSRLQKMGESAMERINSHFHVTQTIDKNWQLYNELLAEK